MRLRKFLSTFITAIRSQFFITLLSALVLIPYVIIGLTIVSYVLILVSFRIFLLFHTMSLRAPDILSALFVWSLISPVLSSLDKICTPKNVSVITYSIDRSSTTSFHLIGPLEQRVTLFLWLIFS